MISKITQQLNLLKHKSLILVVLLAVLVRVVPLDFPTFTTDEARIAQRGFALSQSGKDELGRPFPWIFNSLEDYQLPATSYITASGILLFGKNDVGARAPFILIGVILVILTFKAASRITGKSNLAVISAFIVALSPVLIFLSKVPNEYIVLSLLLTSIYLLISKQKIGGLDIVFILLLISGSLLTSKYAWFILTPFLFTLIYVYQKNLAFKKKWLLHLAPMVLTALVVISFLQIPQSKRSLEENNLTLFDEISINNGITKLRGQGMESNWPVFLDRMFFNKSQYLIIGSVHWISHLSPSIYFGEFDKEGRFGFVSLGAWAKVLIIPFIFGMVFLVKKGNKDQRLLFVYFLLLTWPAIFVYPKYSLGLVVLTLPFMAVLLALGFHSFKKNIFFLITSLVLAEVVLSIFFIPFQQKATDQLRPSWILPVLSEVQTGASSGTIAISDDVSKDLVSHIEWNLAGKAQENFFFVDWPYRFVLTEIKNIKTIGAHNSFNLCEKSEQYKIIVSKRDLDKINSQMDINILKSYSNKSGEEKAFLLSNGVCIR